MSASAPERLPPGVVHRPNGAFQSRVWRGGRLVSLGHFATPQEAADALEAACAEWGVPPPRDRRRPSDPPPDPDIERLPSCVYRRPSGRLYARVRHEGRWRNTATVDSVAEALAELDRLRAELNLAPAPTPTPQPATTPSQPLKTAPERTPKPPKPPKPSMTLDPRLDRWRGTTEQRIQAIVERDDGQPPLPPDPRRKPPPTPPLPRPALVGARDVAGWRGLCCWRCGERFGHGERKPGRGLSCRLGGGWRFEPRQRLWLFAGRVGSDPVGDPREAEPLALPAEVECPRCGARSLLAR